MVTKPLLLLGVRRTATCRYSEEFRVDATASMTEASPTIVHVQELRARSYDMRAGHAEAPVSTDLTGAA
ncbi:hypothetical protein ABN034_05895 [Actinopolymorpha sp. B11F2]|uniref:hypothetical protein n=1 Tax=Actinopolymorpha sp. B11F2 TaxID=3160862 RepID=UPI0032E3DBAE